MQEAMQDGTDLLSKYAAALYLFGFVVVILTYSYFRERMLLKRNVKRDPLPAAKVLERTIADTPALLAVALTGTVVVLAVTRTYIPKLVSDAFFIAVAYYFGERTGRGGLRGEGEPGDGDQAAGKAIDA